ncbi:touch receptor neuron protein Mec-17-domain-containing protein, partial [Pavlovales sp. CCMP2436]
MYQAAPVEGANLELPLEVSAHVQHDALLVLRSEDLDASRGPWRVPADAAALGRILDRLGYESAVAQGLRHRRNGGAGDVAPITSAAQLKHSGHVALLWVIPSRTERVRLRGAAQPASPPRTGSSAQYGGGYAGGGGRLGGSAEAESEAALSKEAAMAAATVAEEAMWTDVTRYSAVGLLKMGSKHLFLATPRGGGHLKECTPMCCLDFYVLSDTQRQGVGRRLFEAMLEVTGARPDTLAYDRPSPKLRGFLRKHYGLANEVSQTNNFCVFEPFFRTGAIETDRGGPRRQQ